MNRLPERAQKIRKTKVMQEKVMYIVLDIASSDL